MLEAEIHQSSEQSNSKKHKKHNHKSSNILKSGPISNIQKGKLLCDHSTILDLSSSNIESIEAEAAEILEQPLDQMMHSVKPCKKKYVAESQLDSESSYFSSQMLSESELLSSEQASSNHL